MARSMGDNDWGTESRLDRQNSANSEGWSRLPGDSAYDDEAATRRRTPAPRSWLRALALPTLACVILGGLAIYAMTMWLERG